MNIDKLIQELLKKRGIETESEIKDFLNPTTRAFHDPFLLLNMDKAVARINKAIQNKEKVVIYGDYDSDGICAVSILFLYLKSRGLEPQGFIPNRHNDGYGLSSSTVRFIAKNYAPNLVITVDTGITAVDEINLFKKLKIDTIVTDHHEPPEVLPNTIVVDPKIKNQKYPFNGLSGAGVAFKIIEALSGLETALEYADITAISTIGDIVPLLDENRVIVKLGLDQINGKNPRPSIAMLKNKLKLKTLSSTDVAFKVVPRLNACGRISTAEKCLYYLTEANPNKLYSLYQKIEDDNNLRLSLSADIFTKINEELKSIDLNKTRAIFILDETINLGLIGIVASKLVNILNRPIFVFSADDKGFLKASVRSVEGINIFEILDKYRELTVDVGGHSLAGGLTITKENYEKLKSAVEKELEKIDTTMFVPNSDEVDAVLDEKDISLELIKRVNELEPFGFMNPKPVFGVYTNSTNYQQMKSIKHYKISIANGGEVVSFFGENLAPYFKLKSPKELKITLEEDDFFAKPKIKAMLKSVDANLVEFNNETKFILAKDLYYKYLTSVDYLPVVEMAPKNIDNFNSIFITDNYEQAKTWENVFHKKIVLEAKDSGESVIVYNPVREIKINKLNLYKNVYVSSESLFGYLKENGIDSHLIDPIKINYPSLDRITFKNIYIVLTKNLTIRGNSVFEIIEKLSEKSKQPVDSTAIGVIISLELGFYEITENNEELSLKVKPNLTKHALEQSKIFKLLN